MDIFLKVAEYLKGKTLLVTGGHQKSDHLFP